VLCRQWGNIDLQAVAYVMLAQLEHAQDRPEKAQEAIRSAERLMKEHRLLPKHLAWIIHVLGKLWIAEGNLERASQRVAESGIAIDDPDIPYLREPDYLILLRLLLIQGDYDASLRLSERLMDQAEAAGRMGRVIQLLILQALIFQEKKAIDQALTRLKKALSLARPERYVRTFLDEGEGVAKLLHLAKVRRIETDYVIDLLSTLGEVSGDAKSPAHLIAEPLSAREVEVLRLIETGCSNQEIADKLVISIATVKRHISNIYAKFGVQNRTQAVSMGKELKLFS
jgi:LuxR family maltose regulon positive regulatory protein